MDTIFQFQMHGYTVLRHVYSREQVHFFREQMDRLSTGRGQKWTMPDGVCQHPVFWDVIFHPQILSAVRLLLGPDIRFLQHNDLHVGFSSFHWHRDSVCRAFGKGPDWDESQESYQLVRVGIYLQESSGGFRLGLVRGSHRPDRHFTERERARLERNTGTLTKAMTMLGGKDPMQEHADWIATEPGDCIIFDPRTIHTGSDFADTKYSFFVAYGVPNRHFDHHYRYYRYLRDDLGYRALQPELVERLKSAGLYADEQVSHELIEGAWLPSKVFAAVARHFK